MLAKLLSEKDFEITNFVNDLESKLKEKQETLKRVYAQKDELEKDFRYNLSLLKERDEELLALENELSLKDMELKQLQEEKFKLISKAHESEEKYKDLKCCLKEQENVYLDKLSKSKEDIEKNFLSRDKKELVFVEKIHELSNRLREKEEELFQEIQKNNNEKKKNSDVCLLEMLKIRQDYQEKLQSLQDSLRKEGEKVEEKEFLLQDLTLQNDFKFKKIQCLEEEIVKYKNSEKEHQTTIEIFKDEKSGLEKIITKLEKQAENSNEKFQKQEKDNLKKIQELDEIISGLSERNEFLKNEFKQKFTLMEEEMKEVVLEKQVVNVKLEQERGIKEAQKEFYLKKQEEFFGNLKEKEIEFKVLQGKYTNLEDDSRQQSLKLDKMKSFVHELDKEKLELRRKLSLEGEKFIKKINELSEKNMIMDRQRREKEIEINKLTRDFEILEKEKEELLENFKKLEKSNSNHEQKSAKVLELEATNEQLSSIIHQMRLDMESLQEEFKLSQQNNAISPQEVTPNDHILMENNKMKIEITELQSRIKKITNEKNRLVDISNSVRSHIRNWKEAQENRHERSTQTNIVLNSSEIKDNSTVKNPRVVARQSDKETLSQNRSRTKLTKLTNNEHPEKLQASMHKRALGVRNWNDIHD